MGEESKMRKVTVTMELEVSEGYKMLDEIKREVKSGIVTTCHPIEKRITVISIDVSGKGFYHLVPDEPAEE